MHAAASPPLSHREAMYNLHAFSINRNTNAGISHYLLKYGYLEQETALFPRLLPLVNKNRVHVTLI